jgi:hypothetical protein
MDSAIPGYRPGVWYNCNVGRGDEEPGAHGYDANRADYGKRLSRIEGQVRGLSRMVEEDKYCIDVLTQISTATSALQSAAV